MKKDNLANKIFIVILVMISLVIILKLIKNSNEYNLVDNRTSYRFDNPSLNGILSGEYQNNVEDAVADQMPKYNYFKLAYIKFSNYINIKTVYLLNLDKLNRYIKVGNINLYQDYLLYTKGNEDDFFESAKNDIDEINDIINNTDASIYMYFVETDMNYDFVSGSRVDVFTYLDNNLEIDKDNIGIFNIENFENYKEYFYKTDHHWNYKGANKGYNDIVSLMNLDNVLYPISVICFDGGVSKGSKAKNVGSIDMFSDRMCKYEYEFPMFDIYVNGEIVSDYGFKTEELMNEEEISYGEVYGDDYAEIVFNNNGLHNNKKLLIYANSYSNAINKLLASHYKETYVIDGRHYKDKSLIEYINDNKIDDVLILANNMLFNDEINW